MIAIGPAFVFGARKMGQVAPCESRSDGGAVCADGYYAPGCEGAKKAADLAGAGTKLPAWSLAVGAAGLALTAYLVLRR